MSHKVGRAELGGETEQQAGQKRVRVADEAKHHQDSKYRGYKPDFAALARQYPDSFGPFVTYLDAEKTEAVLDWEDPKAARALTQTLLHHDFGLEWDIPLERLCPPVPNRLNYICWVEDLLRLGRAHAMMNTNDVVVRGLDVGTGASAIYPLLGCKVYGWHFLGTDIDPVALEAARANVRRNKLEDRIKLTLVPRVDYSSNVTSSTTAAAAAAAAAAAPQSSLLGPIRMALAGEDEEATKLDFVMCNPPFFGSLIEIHAGSINKDGSSSSSGSSSEGPSTAPQAPQTPHGCVGEVITPGGELDFVTAMVRDSLVLREKVGWYTSMVGKKSSLRKLLAVLREAGVRNVRTTEFLQGRTTRWGIGWSFTDDGLEELEGGGGSVHKVFGKKKVEKKREAVHSFVVKEGEGEGGREEEGQGLDEGAVLQRVLDYFHTTKQIRVVRVGIASGGAEDLYRKMVLAGISGQGMPEAPPLTVASAFAVPPVPPSDPAWKSQCVVVVTMLAGAAEEEEKEKEDGGGVAGMEVEKGEGEEGGEGGHWVKVTVEMTSGGDRAVFWKLCSLLPGEVARTNRKWRRKLKGGGGEGGSGGGEGRGGGGVTGMVARLNV